MEKKKEKEKRKKEHFQEMNERRLYNIPKFADS